MKFYPRIISSLLLSFLLASCAVQEQRGEHDAAVLGAACPSHDFEVFLEKFVEDVRLQEVFTEDPLKKMVIVDADPEPAPERMILPRGEIEFPVISDSRQRSERGLTLQLRHIEDGRAEVRLEKPDTDYQVLYFFEQKACWVLTEIEDWSL